MKKKFNVFMMGMLVLSLVGCNNANSSNDTNDTDEKEETVKVDEKKDNEVIFSDVIINQENGIISGSVKNNTDYFIDSIEITVTLDEHSTNGYGEDIIEEVEFTSDGARAIRTDHLPPIYHLDAGEEKAFSFGLSLSDLFNYDNPVIDTELCTIMYRGNNENNNVDKPYLAMENEYELDIVYSDNGEIEKVNITNSSEYQWSNVEIYFEYFDKATNKISIQIGYGNEIDKGATVTIDLIQTGYVTFLDNGQIVSNGAENIADEADHINKILHVTFTPRKSK